MPKLFRWSPSKPLEWPFFQRQILRWAQTEHQWRARRAWACVECTFWPHLDRQHLHKFHVLGCRTHWFRNPISRAEIMWRSKRWKSKKGHEWISLNTSNHDGLPQCVISKKRWTFPCFIDYRIWIPRFSIMSDRIPGWPMYRFTPKSTKFINNEWEAGRRTNQYRQQGLQPRNVRITPRTLQIYTNAVSS